MRERCNGGIAAYGAARTPAILAVIEEVDPRRQIELYAATQPGINRRSGPLLRTLRGSIDRDPELRARWDQLEAWRLSGQGRFVGMLAERGSLRPGLAVDEAVDVTWTPCSLAVHDLLVLERGWTPERYQAWLTEALTGELLPR